MKKIILTALIVCGTITAAFAGHFGPRHHQPPKRHQPHHVKHEVRPAPKHNVKPPAKPQDKHNNHHRNNNHHRR